MEAFLKSVPKEWKVLKLYEVASVRGSSKIRAHINRRHYRKIAFIPMDLIPQEGIYCNYELRDPEDIRSYVYCRAGDILLAKITPSFENGKQGIVPLDIPGGFALATTEVYPIAPDETKIDCMFLFYLLKWHPYRKYLEHRMRGTTGRRRVPRDALLNLNIPLPPLDEQRKIARILYTIDEAIAKTETIIFRVEELRRALLDYLMTYGIGHKEYKETEIGKIPKEWKIVKVGDVAKIDTKSIRPKAGEKYYYIGLEDIESETGRILKDENELVDGSQIKSAKYIFSKEHVLYGRLRPF